MSVENADMAVTSHLLVVGKFMGFRGSDGSQSIWYMFVAVP